ncbi:hypothetical protein HYU22_04245 [Candidatus Woesearchaeota archaeon]|nr:hypothetical protein [Candidatus Woesearchaeota archaeon]
MTLFFTLRDGTKYQIEKGPSGRAVLVEFKLRDLERLLTLTDDAWVWYRGSQTTFGRMRKELGDFVGYFQTMAYYNVVRDSPYFEQTAGETSFKTIYSAAERTSSAAK